MTGDTMKSDFTMDSKYRSEGRLSLPRRRVTTKTAHENGDFEMELSLAIKESLKYAKEKEGQLKRVDRTSPLLNGVQTDESFSRMAGKMLSFATSSDQGQQGSEEIQQLKDLLLIHIELIQHQQELLARKDKEIRLLRNEKDTLHCRLVKAEKRVSQMKQKEDLLEAQIASAREIAAEAAVAVPEPAEKKVAKPEQSASRKRRQRQPNKLKRPGKPKRQRLESDKGSESATSVEQDESCAEDSDSSEDEDVEDSSRGEGGDSEGDGGKDEVEREDEGEDSEEDDDVKDTQDEIKDPHPAPVLRTECLYHVACCVETPPEELVEFPEEEKEVITGDLETPGWRINVLTNRYQLEGTENITDEAYQKRHQKHEMEEKRRKRWDIQRMREQRVFEKLKTQEEGAGSSAQETQPPKTFLPKLEDLTHVEILDAVAVTAFGHAVPHVEPSEFELPWDTGPSCSFTRKSHGGRGRQK
ncbi:male-specific lethal 1 homolog isoform X2 [Littorina saxatilis]|uniref:PEHE domain-containing protein n=1 Tax=Littorina saxatilis TaxID=31220 RepID=A0AAN9BNH6_9CAEN